MEIPTGKIDFSEVVNNLYQNEIREKLFNEAYQKYPDYQGANLYEAADHILDGFEAAEAAKYSPEKWQEISGLLYEQIVEGLS